MVRQNKNCLNFKHHEDIIAIKMCNRANPTQLGFMNNYQSCFLVTGDVSDMMGTRLSAKCRQEVKHVFSVATQKIHVL